MREYGQRVQAESAEGFGSLADKLRAFGLHTVTVDGHDPSAVAQAIATTPHAPSAIVANTKKGCGVSFMENRFEWHYLPLSDELYAQAVRELNSCVMHSAAHS